MLNINLLVMCVLFYELLRMFFILARECKLLSIIEEYLNVTIFFCRNFSIYTRFPFGRAIRAIRAKGVATKHTLARG